MRDGNNSLTDVETYLLKQEHATAKKPARSEASLPPRQAAKFPEDTILTQPWTGLWRGAGKIAPTDGATRGGRPASLSQSPGWEIRCTPALPRVLLRYPRDRQIVKPRASAGEPQFC